MAACLGTGTQAAGGTPDTSCQAVAFHGKQPVDLAKSGRYCLTRDIAWSQAGPAVRIATSDVTLDLGGHAILGEVETKDQIGIAVEAGVKQITVENGAIRHMQIGIQAQDVDRLMVKKMELSDVSWFGMHISGNENAVVESRLSDIGHLDDGGEGDAYAVGILAAGAKLVIQDNEFHNINRQPVDPSLTGEGVAILLSEGSSDVRIADNDFSVDKKKLEDTIGLWARSTNVALEGNRFANIERPVEGAYDGTTRVVGNLFERPAVSRRQTKADAGSGQRAIALALQPTSQIALRDNQFKGYACPIQLFGRLRNQNLKSQHNKAEFPLGGRACAGVGSWHSRALFRSKPTSTRP
jgi:hypothetical protein